MENYRRAYQFKVEYSFEVWTDDFILPKMNNVSSSSITPYFMIELRVQQFRRCLSEKGDSIVNEPRGSYTEKSFCLPSNALIHDDDAADSSFSQILRSVGVPLILPVIRGVSSFARTMMSHPANFGRPLLPIVVWIAVTGWDPRDLAMAHGRKIGCRSLQEEEEEKEEDEEEEEERMGKKEFGLNLINLGSRMIKKVTSAVIGLIR